MARLQFPAGLDAASFLKRHWQKQPLLMRDALPDLRLSLGADEVAGLALEPDVEARLVSHDGAGRYQLLETPFARSELTSLPGENWTLLVQDVEKHLPELARFLDLFDFLPGWRFDDLMISVAAPGGGVGPHIDQYDVFLCQVEGHRRWSLGDPRNCLERRGSVLRLLEDFEPTDVMTLGPGDVLYLPPGIPHDGTAEDLCTTWSVGFRAPSQFDLARELLPQHQQRASERSRYEDADLLSDEVQDALIGRAALRRFRTLLGDLCDMHDAELLPRIGRYLTQPKPWLRPEPPARALPAEIIVGRMNKGESLLRHGMSLFARAALENKHWLFVSGEAIAVGPELWPLAQRLCARRGHSAKALKGQLRHAPAQALLTKLYNDGQLVLDGDL